MRAIILRGHLFQGRYKAAEVDSEVNAKIAEKKIFLEGQMATAEPAEKEEIRRQLVSELARLEEKREREKEKLRCGVQTS